MPDDRQTEIDGEDVKRYGLSYGGQVLGSWDTARKAYEFYRKHDQDIRPIIEGPKRKHRYSVRAGQKDISIEQLVELAKLEK
jgi:hypothetical protein